MKLNALFDRRRKKQIKDALKRGDISVFRRRPPAALEADDEKATRVPDGRPEDDRGYMVIPLGERGIDHDLVQAVREGDVDRVIDAINNGADVNASVTVSHSIRPRRGDCQIYFKTTPLAEAEKMDHKEIAEILKRHKGIAEILKRSGAVKEKK